mmetsp:Transcript_10556/g.32904  ORF Transcript_10556/g.32904 Transcript_10556/m.32904 type:complete len:974 (-) Transcript_10556:49-2970(-)
MAAAAVAVVAAWVAYLPLAAAGLPVVSEHNAASMEPAGQASALPEVLLEIGSRGHMQALMANMTTPLALRVLPAAPRELEEFIAQKLGSSNRPSGPQHAAFLQMRTKREEFKAYKAAKATVAVKAGVAASTMSADEARKLLNSMAEESARKLDMEKAKCAETCEKQRVMTEEARRDIGEYNSQGAAARARIIVTQSGIVGAEEKLPRLQEELTLHESKCQTDVTSLKSQIELLLEDMVTLKKVVNVSKCSSSPSLLVRCRRSSHGARDIALIQFHHHVARRTAAQLRSATARKALQRALAAVAGGRRHRQQRQQRQQHQHRQHRQHRQHSQLHGRHGHHRDHAIRLRRPPRASRALQPRQLPWAPAWYQHTRHHGRRPEDPARVPRPGTARGSRHLAVLSHGRDRGRRLSRMRQEPAEDAAEGAEGAEEDTAEAANESQVPVANTTDEPQDRRMQWRKCAIRTTVDCGYLHDKFLLMQTTVSDKSDGMKESLMKVEGMCEATRRNYEAQLGDLGTRLKDQQAALAEATRVVVEAEEQTRLMGQQLQQLQHEGQRMLEQCNNNLQSIATEICGVKQIRQELYKMDMMRPFIQDCEVSAWTPEECSRSCDGGYQELTRSVVVPANLGVACPPLVMQQKCNEQHCPVDCKLDEWGGWSSCSAHCGGGIKERVRDVRVQASFGGQPCEAISESVSCNNEACDRDCQLAPWSGWSTCSKACDSGFEVRERHVLTPVTGMGSCPESDSAFRLQYRRCNTQPCRPKHDGALQCFAKLDVVILLDGSGSMGEAGWEAAKEAVQMLLKAFQTGPEEAQVALLLFSGPSSMEAYQRCTQGAEEVDLVEDCKIIWVSHFTTDAVTLAANVGKLNWPKATTLTSAALASARAELRSGRAGAQSVVIVVTDGKPMNPRKTGQAALELREKARLIWVPVTRYAPLREIESWASRPVADNVLVLNHFADLAKVETVNRIIADACPIVE